MKNSKKLVALMMAFMLVCMMIPAASATTVKELESEQALIAHLEKMTGGTISKNTATLDEILELTGIKAKARVTRAIAPLTDAKITQMVYGLIDYDWHNGKYSYFSATLNDKTTISFLGAVEFPTNYTGSKTVTPDNTQYGLLIGDYLFVTLQSGWDVSARSALWNGSTSNVRHLASEGIYNASGISIGSWGYYYVDNNDSTSTTTGTFKYTLHGLSASYASISRSDSVIVAAS